MDGARPGRIAGVLALGCLLGACRSEADLAEESRREFQRELRAVVVADGIDQREAKRLADEYFGRHIGACGAVETPIDRGAYWEAPARFGYAAVPIDPLRIDKASGLVSWPGGPTVTAAELQGPPEPRD